MEYRLSGISIFELSTSPQPVHPGFRQNAFLKSIHMKELLIARQLDSKVPAILVAGNTDFILLDERDGFEQFCQRYLQGFLCYDPRWATFLYGLHSVCTLFLYTALLRCNTKSPQSSGRCGSSRHIDHLSTSLTIFSSRSCTIFLFLFLQTTDVYGNLD